MLNYSELQAMGADCGFTNVASLDASTLELRPEVRRMCESCRRYNRSWACPPACGDLESFRNRIAGYSRGILVQTVGQLEDEFDGEGMMEAESRHKQNFERMHERLLKQYPQLLALGAGGCTRCGECSYPDAPCRFPDRMTASMEGCGILVLQVCKDNGLRYHYGSKAIAYTSCFLLE